MEHECNSDISCNWCNQNDPQKLDKGQEKLEIRGRAKTIKTSYSISEISLNSESNPRYIPKL